MINAEELNQIALSLPAAEYSDGGWGVNKKGFAWYYNEKVAGQRGRIRREDVLAVRVTDDGEKQMLLAADPQKFFTTDHYNGYPAILVRLDAIEIDELTELLTEAWRSRAPRKLVAEFDAKILNSDIVSLDPPKEPGNQENSDRPF